MKTINWLDHYREKYKIIFLESVTTKNSFIEYPKIVLCFQLGRFLVVFRSFFCRFLVVF